MVVGQPFNNCMRGFGQNASFLKSQVQLYQKLKTKCDYGKHRIWLICTIMKGFQASFDRDMHLERLMILIVPLMESLMVTII
jgi:hypothetical protein